MIEKAKDCIRQKDCSVAAITEDGRVLTDFGSSVRPLLRLYRAHKEELKGAVLADRIIGRAAASILCDAGVSEVYTFVMSESGKELLDHYGIRSSWEEIVPYIANIRGDDLCPMEKIVEGIDDLQECINRLGIFAASVSEPNFDDE